MILGISHHHNLFATRVHCIPGLTGKVVEVSPGHRHITLWSGGLVFDGLEKLSGKQAQAFSFRCFPQITHIRRIRPHVFHVQVVTDRVDVIVRRVVKEMDGGGQAGGVLIRKNEFRVSLENQLDELLVIGGHEKEINRGSPQNAI